MKYSDQIAAWLKELGYTHCFFVAGGSVMHLVESCSHNFTCIPVAHEVAAGIAAEYFNEVSEQGRAFALVTAGPGLTNIITALAGAFLESRELLVVGGQVKTADLARGQVRQRGIQEIDGVSIAAPVAVKSVLVDRIFDRAEFCSLAEAGSHGRKGPVFIEVPLDIQGASVDVAAVNTHRPTVPCQDFEVIPDAVLADIVHRLKRSHRPVLLLGGGISRSTMAQIEHRLIAVGVPVMLTWNAMDRLPACHPMYCGRPNTWGQRAANILIQQADFVLALGTRLGLQQTGFNWQEFVPIGKVVQVDCDIRELQKGHPRVDLAVCGDANQVLKHIANQDGYGNYSEWVAFCREVNDLLPLDDPQNKTAPGYVSPYQFCLQLSQLATSEDVIIPCSSGNANTVMQETFLVKRGQRVFNNGGLASMGYGLSGAIGAAVAARGRRTLLVEGDGGFIQNLQELGTVAVNRLRMKIFLFDNNGYASIRMTQASYFGGHYVGCDTATGLGMPNWDHLFAAYSIPLMRIGAGFERDPSFLNAFESTGPAAFMVPIDPEQTYYPKITSQIAAGGGMVSNPLHRMSPDLSPELAARVFRYLSA